MSAPTAQNSPDLFIVTYTRKVRKLNPYYEPQRMSSTQQYLDEEEEVFSLEDVTNLYKYKDYINVKYYSAAEVFPKFKVVTTVEF